MARTKETGSVRISAGVRRTLWLTAVDHASSPCDWLEHELDDMDPHPLNDYVSKVPNVEELKRKLGQLQESVVFFDAFGWDLGHQTTETTITADLVPLLRHWLELTRLEMTDHSAVLLRAVETGAIEHGDWLPEDDPARDVEDMLLERAYHLWNILGEFGVEPPLERLPEGQAEKVAV